VWDRKKTRWIKTEKQNVQGDGCCGMTLSHTFKNCHYNSLRLKNKTAPHTISSIHHITTSNVPFTSFLAPKPQTKGATFSGHSLEAALCPFLCKTRPMIDSKFPPRGSWKVSVHNFVAPAHTGMAVQRFNRRVCQHRPFTTHFVKEQKDVLSENDVLTPAEDLQRIQFLKEHPREL
jgi:hypothetical protein